nr:CapA family protein [Clostridium sp. Cult2]
MAGDVMMDGSIKRQIDRNGYAYPWEKVRNYFQSSDLSIVNLETSITTRGKKWPEKEYNFRSYPETLKPMKEAGIDVVTLANNHTLDYGFEGLMDTLNHLEKNEIAYAGGGRNKREALMGTVIEREGVKIGIISFSRVIPDVKWYATDKKLGLVGAYDGYTKDMMKRIEELKKEVDIVILSIHWGKEGNVEPRPEEIAVARKAIDMGADIVMGHHPHVLQGIEVYKGKPIFYSLGNFVFGSKNDLNRTTMIGQVIIEDKKIDRIKIIPCTIINGRPIPVDDEKKREKIDYIKALSSPLKTSISEDGIIEINDNIIQKKRWRCYVRACIRRWRSQRLLSYRVL